MKKDSIRAHLKPYSIKEKRITTIRHAFASAIAEQDEYDEARIAEALRFLGQDPDRELDCVYCGEPAQTWDHVFGLVRNGRYSGFGHTLGNLLPCCKDCNSRKGNKDWRAFLSSLNLSPVRQRQLSELLESYFVAFLKPTYSYDDVSRLCSSEIRKLETIEAEITSLIEDADRTVREMRAKLMAKANSAHA